MRQQRNLAICFVTFATTFVTLNAAPLQPNGAPTDQWQSASPMPWSSLPPPPGVKYPRQTDNLGSPRLTYALATLPTCPPDQPVVEFTVGVDGILTDIVLVESSGVDAIDGAFIKDVSRRRYVAGTKDGQPYAMRWRTTIGMSKRTSSGEECSSRPPQTSVRY
jgi:hypothetical protein